MYFYSFSRCNIKTMSKMFGILFVVFLETNIEIL